MKCPRCNTENEGRTICKKCGLFIYHQTSNKVKMTKAQRAKEDTKIVGKKLKKIFSYIWIILLIVVMSGWFVYFMLYATEGGGGFGG